MTYFNNTGEVSKRLMRSESLSQEELSEISSHAQFLLPDALHRYFAELLRALSSDLVSLRDAMDRSRQAVERFDRASARLSRAVLLLTMVLVFLTLALVVLGIGESSWPAWAIWVATVGWLFVTLAGFWATWPAGRHVGS